jgi:hypothetical protein
VRGWRNPARGPPPGRMDSALGRLPLGTLPVGALPKLFAPVERRRVVGYLVVGALLMAVGAVLIAVASIHMESVDDIQTPANARKALRADRSKDAVMGSGIAVLTSGALMFLGFGATSLVAEAIVKNSHRGGPVHTKPHQSRTYNEPSPGERISF